MMRNMQKDDDDTGGDIYLSLVCASLCASICTFLRESFCLFVFFKNITNPKNIHGEQDTTDCDLDSEFNCARA